MHVEWNSLDKKSESSVNVGYVDLGDEAPVVFFFLFFPPYLLYDNFKSKYILLDEWEVCSQVMLPSLKHKMSIFYI